MNIAATIVGPGNAASPVADFEVTANLVDGRTVNVPLAWSWRLPNATAGRRDHRELIGDGTCVRRVAVRRAMRRLGQLACFGLAWSSLALLAAAAPHAVAQVNPLSALGRVVSTTMDARSKQDVAADTEIGAAASKQLLEDKAAEWTGVTVLVFQRHVVLAGAVKTEAVRKRVEELVRKDKRIRSLNNELMVGNVGSLARDTALEARINAALTAASGVSSVNMRWCATGGHVVLMGVAQSAGEAALANAKLRGLSGVKSIKSHLRVVARKK